MSRYFCPFCSIRYQFHKTNSEGVLICGQCGDPLIKKPFINTRQIFGLVAALSFLSPLLIMFVLAFKDFNELKPPKRFESSVQLPLINGN